MKFTLEINMDNATFKKDEMELVNLIDGARERVENGSRSGAVYDTNGNKVGRYSVRTKDRFN